MKYLVSACLLGENCKYNGGNNKNQELVAFLTDKSYIPVCPEVMGGLSTPRASCEIVQGHVMNTDGEDKTKEFLQGAKLALTVAQQEQIDIAITQSRSPSCGKGKRYSGNFDGTLMEGNGIFVDMLMKHGFQVMDVEEFMQAIKQAKL